MKRMFVFLIACFLCFSTVTISYAAVPAFDNTQWLELPSGFGGGSHNYPQSTVVTYSDLKAIRLQVNSWLSEGQYKGFRGTASISYNGSTYVAIQSADTDVGLKVVPFCRRQSRRR